MQACLILGYDRTDSARVAARWAVEQLLPAGRLVLVHASRPLHAPTAPSTAAERRRFGRALIDELLLEGEDSLFDIDIEVEVADSDPVSALLEAARRHRAQAIVVGCQRHSRLHTAIGTVTVQLLGNSPVPVVVVPALAGATPEAMAPLGSSGEVRSGGEVGSPGEVHSGGGTRSPGRAGSPGGVRSG
jgi:nucleotide-binding universal stress UspA family protein